MDLPVPPNETENYAFEWDYAKRIHNVSESDSQQIIKLASQLIIDLVDSLPSEKLCFLLRKRAQHYCLTLQFDEAIIDLQMLLDIASQLNDNETVEECRELIKRVVIWRYVQND